MDYPQTYPVRGVTMLQCAKILQKVNFLTVSIAACITCSFSRQSGRGDAIIIQLVHAWVDYRHQKESSYRVAKSHFIE